MLLLRSILVLMLLAVVGYTGVVVSRHGPDFLTVFFGDIARFAWAGQFNLDFFCLLLLSGWWVAWRHRFSATGMALGSLAVVAGAPFLCAYLLVHSLDAQGDIRRLLLGTRLDDH